MDFGSRSYRKRALIGRKHNTISVAKLPMYPTTEPHIAALASSVGLPCRCDLAAILLWLPQLLYMVFLRKILQALILYCKQ